MTKGREPPASVSNLTALTGDVGGSVKLRWTMPGEDGTTGTISSGLFRINYRTSGVIRYADYDLGSLTTVDVSTSGVAPMTEVYVTVSGLSDTSTYYFAVKVREQDKNYSLWYSSEDVTGINDKAAALPQVDVSSPNALADLAVLQGPGTGQLYLTWTAPGDDGNSGNTITYSNFRRK